MLRPTLKEFKNFSEYVEKLDKLYKKNYGMVKVDIYHYLEAKASRVSFLSLSIILGYPTS